MTKPTAALVTAVLLAACASTPQPTRDEWLAATSRTYQGVTADEVLSAAEKVIRLSDPDDVTFEYAPDRLIAKRDWMFYGVFNYTFATETWNVTANQRADGAVLATVNFQGETSGFGAMPDYGPKGTSTYDMFWDRVDYMLGQRADWAQCENKLTAVGLCGNFSSDLEPSALAAGD